MHSPDQPNDPDKPSSNPAAPEADQPPFLIEGARSGRAKCKLCRKAIDKGTLRLGTLIEGPYGTGYIWEHLLCAARRAFPKVEQAYERRAWELAKDPPSEVPELSELEKLREEAERKRAERQEIPYAEFAPSGRSRCKHSGDHIEKGALRVVLGREVSFGNQTRTTPINVKPEHVADALAETDCATEAIGFPEALRTNSKGLESAVLDALLEQIGPLE